MIDRAEMIRQAVAVSQAAEVMFEAGQESFLPFIDADTFTALRDAGGSFVVTAGVRWCDQCAVLLDELEKMNDISGPLSDIPTYRVDLDQSPDLIDEFSAQDAPPSITQRFDMQLPVVVLYRDGAEQTRFYGSQPPDDWPHADLG